MTYRVKVCVFNDYIVVDNDRDSSNKLLQSRTTPWLLRKVVNQDQGYVVGNV